MLKKKFKLTSYIVTCKLLDLFITLKKGTLIKPNSYFTYKNLAVVILTTTSLFILSAAAEGTANVLLSMQLMIGNIYTIVVSTVKYTNSVLLYTINVDFIYIVQNTLTFIKKSHLTGQLSKFTFIFFLYSIVFYNYINLFVSKSTCFNNLIKSNLNCKNAYTTKAVTSSHLKYFSLG